MAKKVISSGKERSAIEQLLQGFPWISDLRTEIAYSVQTDDSDGDPDAPRLSIVFSRDGDAHILTTGTGALRIRTGLGGGRYPHTYFALEILAEAMRLDLEDIVKRQ